MTLEPVTLPILLAVLADVWPTQAAEIAAHQQPGEYLPEYAKRLLTGSVLSHVWRDAAGVPVACAGWILLDEHTATSWMFHTTAGLQQAPAFVRVVRRAMRQMGKAGVTRFEATTLEHAGSARWYRAFGMARERELIGAGAHGETLALYARGGM